MSSIRLTGFNGVIQAAHALTLPDTVGVSSSNARSGFGDLRAWPAPTALALAANTVVTGATSLYRYGRDTASDLLYWLTFVNDTDVVRGMVGNDSTERTYLTDGAVCQWIDNTFALGSVPYPNSPRTLGVPAPATSPTVNPTGGTSTSKESRVYVWTWVTDKGEESAPSPNNTATALSPIDATWQVTFNEAVPAYNGTISKRRLYRSATTTSGTATYLFVAEVTNLTSGYTYNDTVAGTALGSTLATLYWTPPPTGLRGLKAMWNGMMAGFVGKTVWFCEQYVPYAWPSKYSLTINETIIGLAVWQQNLLVLTNGKAYLVTGSSPAALSLQPVDASFSCASKRSICEVPGGVVWAAPEGLVYAGSSGGAIITDLVYTKEQWAALVPSSMVVNVWGTYLLISYNNGSRSTLVIDWEGTQPVYPNKMKVKSVYPSSIQFDMAYHDPLTGELYLLNTASRSISKWNTGSAQSATFTSKLFRQAQPTSFAWAHVRSDAYPLTISVTADGTTVFSGSVGGGRPFRIGGNFKAYDWQITVTTASGSAVQEVVLATSLKELQAIV